jgi:outer membrane protein assembly factor BamB/tetratricopeptide (TPR) repeat protein
MHRTCLVVFVILGAVAFSAAQPPNPVVDDLLARTTISGESQRTAWQFNDAEHLVEQGKWAEAVDLYQRILKEAGDALVPLDARHRLCARRLCHLQLAALPAEALRLYRGRVEGQAKRWLDEAAANRDPALLRRLVDELFCSRQTETALDQLGNLAFEAGRFEEAEAWWRLLALPASEMPREHAKPSPSNREKPSPRWAMDVPLVFPDPQIDSAPVRAKQLLARLFGGDSSWQEEWAAFQVRHANAEGHLAGRQGKLADILRTLARDRKGLAAPRQPESWLTFAGDATRNRVVQNAARLPAEPSLQWTVNLPSGSRVSHFDALSVPRPRREIAPVHYSIFPVIDGDQVLVADALNVSAFNLDTGDRAWHYNLLNHLSETDARTALQASGDPGTAYTLSAEGGQVYARLGATGIGPRKGGETDSYLVCLNRNAGPDEARQRWMVRAPTVDRAPAAFEGAPLYHLGRLYVGVTHFVGTQTHTAIACYDAITGALRWERDVCETMELKEGERRTRHHLVTLASSNIVYCSHSGAIVAIDAATGRRVWAYRYPSRGRKTVDLEPSPRGLAPCVAAEGRLLAAPLDLDRILCLDPETGHLIWESNSLEAIDLLGVSRSRLIFTAAMPRALTPVRSIRALEMATGTVLRGWIQPGDGTDLAPAGRGVLTTDRVLWPTVHGLYILDAEGKTADFILGHRGNVAIANGCLVAAAGNTLSAYLPAERDPVRIAP